MHLPCGSSTLSDGRAERCSLSGVGRPKEVTMHTTRPLPLNGALLVPLAFRHCLNFGGAQPPPGRTDGIEEHGSFWLACPIICRRLVVDRLCTARGRASPPAPCNGGARPLQEVHVCRKTASRDWSHGRDRSRRRHVAGGVGCS